MVWIIAIVVVLVIGFLVVRAYNKLVQQRNRVDTAWGHVDVQLQRRSDLIPNLVATVKGYASHEKEIFDNIAKARAGLVSGNPGERMQADNMLSGALRQLFAVAEAYPDLKAGENFKLLQEQLEGIENKIAYARQYYNSSVLQFNNMITTIPGSWFAGGRGKREFFEVPEEAREVPKVKF